MEILKSNKFFSFMIFKKGNIIMNNSIKILKDFMPKHNFLICIDSDGCVFDSMEIKHKECFCPQFINHFNLQPVSKYAREVWEFVNLYSNTRGCNRFLAILKAVDLLSKREEVIKRKVKILKLNGVKDWIKKETKLGIPALKKEVEKLNVSRDLKIAYQWSIDVNQSVEKIVRNIQPFPYVKECFKKMKKNADIIIVSQTPIDSIIREWKEHHIDIYPKIIAGQELGTKAEHIKLASKGKYDPYKILMIGDAPGDLDAAKNNEALFFPIIPSQEESSWKLLFTEALDKFFNGDYAGIYEKKIIDKFKNSLPVKPFWDLV